MKKIDRPLVWDKRKPLKGKRYIIKFLFPRLSGKNEICQFFK